MTEEQENFVKNRKLATFRVVGWIGLLTKTEISKRLCMSRPTLNIRLKNNNWTFEDIKKITKELPF